MKNFHPFQTISTIFSLLFLGILIYVVYVFVREWRKTDATKTKFQRAIDAAKSSETILWSQFCIAVASIFGQVDVICDYFNLPEVKNFIDTWIGNPKVIAAIALVVATITIKARLRHSSNDPVN